MRGPVVNHFIASLPGARRNVELSGLLSALLIDDDAADLRRQVERRENRHVRLIVLEGEGAGGEAIEDLRLGGLRLLAPLRERHD